VSKSSSLLCCISPTEILTCGSRSRQVAHLVEPFNGVVLLADEVGFGPVEAAQPGGIFVSAEEDVIAGVTVNLVISVVAVEFVVAFTAVDFVVIFFAIDFGGEAAVEIVVGAPLPKSLSLSRSP